MIPDEEFVIAFAAWVQTWRMRGIFPAHLWRKGVSDHVVMFLNLANDPLELPYHNSKVASLRREYLAFEQQNKHSPGYFTDMTSLLCGGDAWSILLQRREIPSRKGFPDIFYSELATILWTRRNCRRRQWLVTAADLTMPNDDITHNLGFLTYRIYYRRTDCTNRAPMDSLIYPPINILPSFPVRWKTVSERIHCATIKILPTSSSSFHPRQ